MIEFIYQLSDSEEEFLAVGYYLNQLASLYSNNSIYVPLYLTDSIFMKQANRKNNHKANKFMQLREIISKFTPHSSTMKFSRILNNFGGQKIYIPSMDFFRRRYRNQRIINCREIGFSYAILSSMFDLSITALRKIVDNSYLYKKTGKLLE